MTQREIRFRAFVTHDEYRPEKKGMYYGVETAYDTLGYMGDGKGGEREYYWQSFGDVVQKAKAGEIILMQFTGLHDKTGKEIFEGDCFGGIWEGHYVGWCKEQAAFQGFNCLHECGSCGGDFQFDEMIDNELGIIGNIWENPELISKEV